MSTTAEILKKVRKIEIKTRGLSSQVFSGEYHSAFKGRGMAFSEVREYTPGDDVRTIDWNVTARLGDPYVKIFEEERELTVILMVDVSASESFGSKNYTKRDLITELCAVLSFSAIQNNDKIGVILFTDRIEKFIPPKKGKKHILRIIRELIEFEPEGTGTDIGEALRYLSRVIRKKSIAFLISDMLDDDLKTPLNVAGRKHDLVALRLRDQREVDLPNIGWVEFRDPETGAMKMINTARKKVRNHYKAKALEKDQELKKTFRKAGVDSTDIWTHRSYIEPLMELFKRREGK